MELHADMMGSNLSLVENPQKRSSANRCPGVLSAEALQKRIDSPNFTAELAEVRWTSARHAKQLATRYQADARRPPRPRFVHQRLRDSILYKSVSPATNGFHIYPKLLGNFAHTWVLFKSQDEPSSNHLPVCLGVTSRGLLQLPALCPRQPDFVFGRQASAFSCHAPKLNTFPRRGELESGAKFRDL
jgi:hypothetical protein